MRDEDKSNFVFVVAAIVVIVVCFFLPMCIDPPMPR